MQSTQQLEDRVKWEDELEEDAIGALCVPRKIILSYKLIPTDTLSGESKRLAIRLNSFANLFYFGVQVLGKSKFQLCTDPIKNLHLQMCLSVMKDGLKEVIEIPRDHFKSSIYSECFPLWRALPFGDKDADLLYKLGYPEIYIQWMRRAHKQDIRTLLVSENIKNAVKLGTKISNTYKNNNLFAHVFPEVMPDASCTWVQDSIHQKRTPKGSQHGEGTFDFIGVGGALQSRHYDMVVQDDLVGRAALKSEKEMADTIEYHQLLVGAFDADNLNSGRDNDEIVVGNRWSFKDLNSHIRANETYFNFITHSALGGCCSLHPWGIPIFPEAFSIEKLARWKQRLGSYLFSCQFLNYPINPEKLKFDKKNLRYFHYERDTNAVAYPFQKVGELETEKKKQYRIKIRHHVHEGDVEEDIFPRTLTRYMIVDPNHSGNKGRCRHAITVTGISVNPRRVYLLQQWAKSENINVFVEQIFKMAMAWKINTIHLETNGAQKYLQFHLEYFIQTNKHKPEYAGIEGIRIADLKSPNTAGAKEERIDSFIPVTERGEFWIDANNCTELMEEIEHYGNSNGLIDLLDTLGYGPQVWKFPEIDDSELAQLLTVQKNRFVRAMSKEAA